MAATTGVPQACASTATSPNDSLCEGTASTSAARYHWARVGRSTGGTKRTRSPMPRCSASSVEAHRVAHAGAAGPAEDGDDDPRAQVGAASHQLGSGLDEHVGRLERLDAADEQEEHGIRGDADARPAPRRCDPGWNDGEVDTGLGDDDPVGVGVVEVDELSGLAVGVGDEPVGGLDDLGLTDLAAHRLGQVTVGEVEVLDPGHRVHRVHERHAPAVGGQPADLAGEPVVRVDEVVVAGRRVRGDAHHPGGEGAQLAREVLLGQALVGAGRHVPHDDARLDLDDGRLGGARGAGEEVDGDAATGELAGDLEHVDVHAAGVALAGLGQRGGVHGDHRDPLQGRCGSPGVLMSSSLSRRRAGCP